MQSNAIFADRESYVVDDKDKSTYPVYLRVRKPRREDAIAARIQEIEDAGGSRAGIAIESGLMESERVAAWLSGTRSDEDTEKLSLWLDKVDEDIAERVGGFALTPAARRYLRAFEQARAPRDSNGRRGVAMIFGGSGAGKTAAAKYAERMDGGICYVLADGETRTWTRLLAAVAGACGAHGAPNTGETLKDLVLRRLPAGGLMIFDHAHLMKLSIMEQLLVFPEEHQIGLAFVGNLQLHKTLTDKKLTQLTSRASGATVIVGIPSEDEVDAHLLHLGISGRKEREFCQLIARQDGGLRFLYDTVRKARELAVGISGATLSDVLLRKAAAKIGCWTES